MGNRRSSREEVQQGYKKLCYEDWDRVVWEWFSVVVFVVLVLVVSRDVL